jgi:PD-(D/E)XK nuclease superfamily protein
MPQSAAERRESPRQQVTLHVGSSFQAASDNVLLPWFQTAARISWQQQKPTLVVVPFRSHASAIKGRLLDRGVSLLGIRFVSPPELRAFLSSKSEMRLPLREHLRLLLSIAAEECMKLPDDPTLREKRMLEADFLAAKSVARAPDHFLRAIDQLGAAGWEFSAVELPALREVEAHFQKHVAHCGFELIHASDLRAATNAGKADPLFANILVTGFNGAHWPLWQLLRAGVSSAEQATVLLDDPRDQARELDEAWVGTWEEFFGEAKPISPAVNQINDSLFTDAEMQGATVSPAKYSFVVGADTTQQAEAIALMCVRFLAEKKCTRVGVVFAGAGSLSRLVVSALSRLAIPHNDGFGHPVPELFESAEWRAWLQLQRGPRVNSLLRFLSSLRNREELFPDLNIEVFERRLRSAHAEVLIDDLTVLQKFCAASAEQKDQQVAKALQLIEFLPARGNLSAFLHATENAFARLSWKQQWIEVASRSNDWAGKVEADFSRILYLRWLEEIASSFGVERDAAGDHPYARVHLLPVAQALGQEWSHLIFAGFNEGSWPPAERGEFAREEEIQKFNRNIRQLNRRSAKQGSQGEGHTSVREGHTLYLGPSEQRQIALRQFQTLLESVTEGVAFGASLAQETAPERLWNPNEMFTRHYQQTHHSPLTQVEMSRLQDATRLWLQKTWSPTNRATPLPAKIEQTRMAYNARRDPATPAGEYDFAFRSTPPAVPTLSVSEFEKLLSSPALVWLNKYLGVKAAEENGNVWNTSSGKWVHDWLAAIAAGARRTFTRLPDISEIERRICAAAEAKRSQVAGLCEAAGKPLPDWWIGGWRNALFLARVLGEKIATIVDWPWMATEWTIEGGHAVKVIESTALSLRGRIDLLLARAEPAAGSLATEELWIIDYKTGAKKALAAGPRDAAGHRSALRKKLLDGSALQLGLYALAAAALGAERTEVSLLSLLVRPLDPQISGADFASEMEIFANLAEMQRTGVYGMHGPLRSAFRFTDDYPLATLAIEPDILEQRWELTHPALVRDEEDIFW